MAPVLDRERLVAIGWIAEAHGVGGAMKVRPLTDAPGYYEGCRIVYMDSAEGLRRYRVNDLRLHGSHWILAGEEVSTREEAAACKGAELLIGEEALRPLEREEYFRHELVGCAVETLAGESLGSVREVWEHTAQDMLVVSDGRRAVLLPLVSAIVREVDIAAKRIRVEPPPGLLDLNG